MGVIGSSVNQYITQQEVKRQRRKVDDIIKKIKEPDFDFTKISPEDYKVLQKYEPEVADFVVEKNPTLVLSSKDGDFGRETQMDALSKYRNLSKTGEDAQSRLLTDSALRDSAIQDQGQRASIQDDMARRGMSGSGLDLASQLMAQQGSSQRGTLAAQQQAMNAYNTRLDALKNSENLGGQIRSDDLNLAAQNAAISNDYNQRYAQNQNNYNQYASGERNDAQRMNISAAQQAADQNVENRNASAKSYQDMVNSLKQQQFGNSVTKQGMLADNAQGRVQDAINAGKDREASMAATRGMIASFYSKGASGSPNQGAQSTASSPQQSSYAQASPNQSSYANYQQSKKKPDWAE